MSGHSKWAQIKRKKAKTDQQRGKLFSKLVREVTTAARAGGDPKLNMRLKAAIEEAKGVNMPADTLKRAIQKGTGELPGETYEEITYEGYGPGGVALLVKVLTDNKNRTAPEIRHTFSKFGGNLAEVLSTVSQTIRDRYSLKRQIKALSAEGRLSSLILSILPVVMFAALLLLNPVFLRPLFTTTMGITMLAAAAVLMVLGVFWLKKITEIKV